MPAGSAVQVALGSGRSKTWGGLSGFGVYYVPSMRNGGPNSDEDRELLRLDHVFYRLAPGWRLVVHRAASRFGSDHYPLVGSLRFR